LRQSGCGNEKSASDFICFQPAQRAQRERHLGLFRKRGVAARKDQSQTVIVNLADFERRLLCNRRDFVHIRFDLGLKVLLAADAIYGLVSRGLNDPRGG